MSLCTVAGIQGSVIITPDGFIFEFPFLPHCFYLISVYEHSIGVLSGMVPSPDNDSINYTPYSQAVRYPCAL